MSFQMSVKKSLSCVLILSQLAFASSVFADEATIPGVSPELSLLTSMTALMGENLSQSKAEAQMTADFERYNQEAPVSGRNERMQNALVQLGMFTPDQAQQFVQQSQSAVSAALANGEPTEKGVQDLESELLHLAPPQGAQFSICETDRMVAFYGFFAGGALMFGEGLTGNSDILAFAGVISIAAALMFGNPLCDMAD